MDTSVHDIGWNSEVCVLYIAVYHSSLRFDIGNVILCQRARSCKHTTAQEQRRSRSHYNLYRSASCDGSGLYDTAWAWAATRTNIGCAQNSWRLSSCKFTGMMAANVKHCRWTAYTIGPLSDLMANLTSLLFETELSCGRGVSPRQNRENL